MDVEMHKPTLVASCTVKKVTDLAYPRSKSFFIRLWIMAKFKWKTLLFWKSKQKWIQKFQQPSLNHTKFKRRFSMDFVPVMTRLKLFTVNLTNMVTIISSLASGTTLMNAYHTLLKLNHDAKNSYVYICETLFPVIFKKSLLRVWYGIYGMRVWRFLWQL